MKIKLEEIEKRILKALVEHGDYASTSHIAKMSGVSWNTAFSYLNKFNCMTWVKKTGHKTIYWRAILEVEK